jgi:hypothetical protein
MLREDAARAAWARARRIDAEKLSRALSSEGVRVLRDGLGPTLEPGPLALYRSAFPERYVVWNGEPELWEVRQLNPVTGQDEHYEFLYWWTAFDEKGNELDPEDVAALEAQREAYLRGRNIEAALALAIPVKLYRPFDYPFVIERLLQWQDFRATTAAERSARIAAHNRRVQERTTHDMKNEWEAWEREDARWLPVLAQHYDTKRTKQRAYIHERIPQIPVGVALS